MAQQVRMNIWDRCAGFVYRVATGNKRLRIILTPTAALLFYGFIVCSVFAALWVDGWLSLPRFNSSWSLGLSVLLMLPGCLMGGWSVIAFFRTGGTPVPFNPPPRLVTTGLYAYVRNPMFLGGFLFLLGLGVLLGSISLTLIFMPLLMLVYVFYVKAVEEKEMEKKFGPEYLEYKKRLPMFIPRAEAFRNIIRRQGAGQR
jgi:protein-S-isoprenylcysteine O-methyltransferase Ste14